MAVLGILEKMQRKSVHQGKCGQEEHPTAIDCHNTTFRRNRICVWTPKIDVVKEG